MIRIFLLAVILVYSTFLRAQDSLSVEVLDPLSYSFEVKDGKISGPGADFLLDRMRKAQYTLIGEYHGSKRISELTAALIPHLDSAGYKTMVLEVGPTAAEILSSLPDETNEGLKRIIQQHAYEVDGYLNIPIPFFEFEEDADFLHEAKVRDWNLVGIDQEYIDSYPMLLEQMFSKLPAAIQKKNQELYKNAQDSLKQFYMDDWNDVRPLCTTIQASPELNRFTKVVATQPGLKPMVMDFAASVEIYALSERGMWFENNETRKDYMKSQLRQALKDLNFDLVKDRIVAKMGGRHLSKGLAPSELFDVGNTFNELAEFYGNSCFNMSFNTRFYMDEGELKDAMDSNVPRNVWYRPVNQMGKQDEWVVIDLKPLLVGSSYYPLKYIVDDRIRNLVERYDVLIIPKTEEDPTPLYESRK